MKKELLFSERRRDFRIDHGRCSTAKKDTKTHANDVKFFFQVEERWHMESEGAITARFYVQITRFLIWEIIVQRASFRLILRGNAGKKKERFLFLYFFFSVFSSSTPCWDWCFHPHFLPSYTLLFRCAFVFISRLFWKEGKIEKKWYRYMQLLLLACGGEGEGLKVGHWPNGGSFPLDWLSYTPIHSARNAQVELQLSSRLHVFFFSYCDPFLLSCVRRPSTSSSAKWHIPRHDVF